MTTDVKADAPPSASLTFVVEAHVMTATPPASAAAPIAVRTMPAVLHWGFRYATRNESCAGGIAAA